MCHEWEVLLVARGLRDVGIGSSEEAGEESLALVAMAIRALPKRMKDTLHRMLVGHHFEEIGRMTGACFIEDDLHWTALVAQDAAFVNGLECASNALSKIDLADVVDRAISPRAKSPSRRRGRPRAIKERVLAIATLEICRDLIELDEPNFSDERLRKLFRQVLHDLFELRGFPDPATWAKKVLRAEWLEKNTSVKFHFKVDDKK